MQPNSEIHKRLLEYIDYLGITANDFSIKIGKSRGYVRSIKDDIGSKVMHSIMRTYPDFNIHWLLTGEGEMLKSQTKSYKPENDFTFSSDSLPEYIKSNSYKENSINIINNLSDSNKSLAKANEALSESMNKMSNIINELMKGKD